MNEHDLAAAFGVEAEELRNYLIRLRWLVAMYVGWRGLSEVVIDEIISDFTYRVLIQRRNRQPDQTAEEFLRSAIPSLLSHTWEQQTIPGRTDEDGKVHRIYRLQSIDALLVPLEDFTSESHQQIVEFNELCEEIRKELRNDPEASAIFQLNQQGFEKPRDIAAKLGISNKKTYNAMKRLRTKVIKVLERLGKCSIKTKN